ncbi:MAG: (2Fe-2S)-binding protein [SAR202 cluster bacterium]|jgi:carbon-monoxide dehydrogenase small subunit|nr:(2Fe-2S)-binding protein [SAR202 cluster bacterium]
MTEKININIKVNGMGHILEVDQNKTLIEVLREELGLTGTKYGCGAGECGLCTVLLDAKPVSSCLTMAAAVDGRKITTIEGVSSNGDLHPIQEAFIKTGAVECGFCTPGMILSGIAILNENPDAGADVIKHYLRGNLCRCTGYEKIIKAVRMVVEESKGR